MSDTAMNAETDDQALAIVEQSKDAGVGGRGKFTFDTTGEILVRLPELLKQCAGEGEASFYTPVANADVVKATWFRSGYVQGQAERLLSGYQRLGLIPALNCAQEPYWISLDLAAIMKNSRVREDLKAAIIKGQEAYQKKQEERRQLIRAHWDDVLQKLPEALELEAIFDSGREISFDLIYPEDVRDGKLLGETNIFWKQLKDLGLNLSLRENQGKWRIVVDLRGELCNGCDELRNSGIAQHLKSAIRRGHQELSRCIHAEIDMEKLLDGTAELGIELSVEACRRAIKKLDDSGRYSSGKSKIKLLKRMGYVLDRDGEPDQALACFLEVLKVIDQYSKKHWDWWRSAERAYVYIDLCTHYLRLGQSEESIAAFRASQEAMAALNNRQETICNALYDRALLEIPQYLKDEMAALVSQGFLPPPEAGN